MTYTIEDYLDDMAGFEPDDENDDYSFLDFEPEEIEWSEEDQKTYEEMLKWDSYGEEE